MSTNLNGATDQTSFGKCLVQFFKQLVLLLNKISVSSLLDVRGPRILLESGISKALVSVAVGREVLRRKNYKDHPVAPHASLATGVANAPRGPTPTFMF